MPVRAVKRYDFALDFCEYESFCCRTTDGSPYSAIHNKRPRIAALGMLCHVGIERLAAQNMEVEVMHRLTGIRTAVADHTVAAG